MAQVVALFLLPPMYLPEQVLFVVMVIQVNEEYLDRRPMEQVVVVPEVASTLRQIVTVPLHYP